jgi:predicted RNA binding protein YcfA (HicA-like mRNA interferase family)
MKFSELVRLLEQNGFRIIKEKGSVRYYSKPGWNNLIIMVQKKFQKVLVMQF